MTFCLPGSNWASEARNEVIFIGHGVAHVVQVVEHGDIERRRGLGPECPKDFHRAAAEVLYDPSEIPAAKVTAPRTSAISVPGYLFIRLQSAYSPLLANEREFLWRGADTKTLLNGTAAPARMEF